MGPRTPRGRRGGFTLLELLIALALIGVVASLSIPAYFDRPEVTLEKACIQLAKDLRHTQNRAAYLGTSACVVFDPEGDGYWVLEGASEPSRAPQGDRDFVRTYSNYGVFEGVSVRSARFGTGGRSLSYGATGRALDAGEVVLVYEGNERTLQVEAGSGWITIVDSSSGWQDSGL